MDFRQRPGKTVLRRARPAGPAPARLRVPGLPQPAGEQRLQAAQRLGRLLLGGRAGEELRALEGRVHGGRVPGRAPRPRRRQDDPRGRRALHRASAASRTAAAPCSRAATPGQPNTQADPAACPATYDPAATPPPTAFCTIQEADPDRARGVLAADEVTPMDSGDPIQDRVREPLPAPGGRPASSSTPSRAAPICARSRPRSAPARRSRPSPPAGSRCSPTAG